MTERYTLGQPAFFAHYFTGTANATRYFVIQFDNIVERIGNLARNANPVGRHTYRKIAFFNRTQYF